MEYLFESPLSIQLNDQEVKDCSLKTVHRSSSDLKIGKVYSLATSEYSDDVDSNFNKIQIKDISSLSKSSILELEDISQARQGCEDTTMLDLEDIAGEDTRLDSGESGQGVSKALEDVIEEIILPVYFTEDMYSYSSDNFNVSSTSGPISGQPHGSHGQPPDGHAQPPDGHAQPPDGHAQPQDRHPQPKDSPAQPLPPQPVLHPPTSLAVQKRRSVIMNASEIYPPPTISTPSNISPSSSSSSPLAPDPCVSPSSAISPAPILSLDPLISQLPALDPFISPFPAPAPIIPHLPNFPSVDADVSPPVKRKRGRPKGSKNKKKVFAQTETSCEKCTILDQVLREQGYVGVCSNCGYILGHEIQVIEGSQAVLQEDVQDVQVLQAPENFVNYPILVTGTEILVEGEKILGVKSPHDGLMGRTNIRVNAPQDITGEKIFKVNVPHHITKNGKFIKLDTVRETEEEEDPLGGPD